MREESIKHVDACCHVFHDPVQTFLHPVARDSAARDDPPVPLAHLIHNSRALSHSKSLDALLIIYFTTSGKARVPLLRSDCTALIRDTFVREP